MESCKGDMHHIDSSEDGVCYFPKCERVSSFPEDGLPADYINKKDMKIIKDVAKTRILPLLPAKSLLKSRAVSKEWDQWIVSPDLALQQSKLFQKLSGYFYQNVDTPYFSNPVFVSVDSRADGVPSPSLGFLPERVEILCSSSGLLLCVGKIGQYFVCNPATKKWECIPPPQFYHGYDPAAVLAFDPNEGKLESYYHIIVSVPFGGSTVDSFEIYSSETNSWELSSRGGVELEYPRLSGGGFYLKGVSYWVTSSNEIVAFDLKNEIPAVVRVPTLETGALAVIADEIFYVTAYTECGDFFEIDLYGGTDMSLKRSVTLNLRDTKHLTCRHDTTVCEVLPCMDNNTVVIYTSEYIYVYRLWDHKIETLESPELPPNPFRRFFPYTNSLAELRDLHE